MSLRVLLATLLVPALALADDTLPCMRGSEPAIRGCLATRCEGPLRDKTSPRMREAGWRVFGCEVRLTGGPRQLHEGEYRIYRGDGHRLEFATLVSYARTPRLSNEFSFDGGPLDVGDEHLFRIDITHKQTTRNVPPAPAGNLILVTTDAEICPRDRDAKTHCGGFGILRDETFVPADHRQAGWHTRETYQLKFQPGSIEQIGPLEWQSPEPRDGSECRRGTLQEVVDCMQAHCAARAGDATPAGLEKAGWRVVQCDFMSEQPVDTDPPIDAGGEVRLYRVNDGQLAFATILAGLGHTAKYWEDTPFDIRRWRLVSIGTRTVLWLEWTLSDPGRNTEGTGYLDTETRYVTVCVADGPDEGTCGEPVPLRIITREGPFTGGPPLVTEQRWDVTTDDAGLVVSGPVGSTDAAVRHVALPRTKS